MFLRKKHIIIASIVTPANKRMDSPFVPRGWMSGSIIAARSGNKGSLEPDMRGTERNGDASLF